MKSKEILLKVGAIVSFLVFVVGGGALAYSGFRIGKFSRVGVGAAVLLLGIFLTAVLAAHIARAEGNKDVRGLTFAGSLKAGAMFTLFAAFLINLAAGLFAWIEYGLWIWGIAGIIGFIVMIIIAVEISVRWQTGAVKKVLADPDAEEFTGRVTSISAHFRIEIFGKKKVFFYKYYVDVSGESTISFLRSRDKMSMSLRGGDTVRIKMNPAKAEYCAILEKIEKEEP